MSDDNAIIFSSWLADEFREHALCIIGESEPFVVRGASWTEHGVELDYVVEEGQMLPNRISRDHALTLLARTYRARSRRAVDFVVPLPPPDYQALLEARFPIYRGSGLELAGGWYDLLVAVAELRAGMGDFHPFVQTKEKFGGLRLYGMMSGEAQYLCDAAEHLSFHVCDVCGKPGQNREIRGWLATRCSEHIHA